MQVHNILFPVDFSGRSTATAPFVHSIAHRHDATVTLLHVIPPVPPVYFDVAYPEPDCAAENVETRLKEFAAGNFPKSEIRTIVRYGEPARTILSVAKEIQSDLIAMPTHGYRGLRRFFLGSVTAAILRNSEIPVWTGAHVCDHEHRAHPQPRRIIAALDLKRDSDRAMQTALSIAKDTGATVEVLHIAPEGTISASAPETSVRRVLTSAAGGGSIEVECAPYSEVQITVSGEGVASMIKRVAHQRRADLVVIGRANLHSHFLDRMNSHAYSVICEVPCPVLSV